MPNLGTYFEIPVNDLERAMKFYSSVFACEFVKDRIHGNEMAFFPLEEGQEGITGALAKGEIYSPSISGTMIYLSTKNLDATIEALTKAGGEILFPRTEVAGHGWVAEFKDCEGNRVALFERKA